MNWLVATILATVFFGVYPIFGVKSGQVHGEKINFIVDASLMFLMALAMAVLYKGDFGRVTRTSFFYSLGFSMSSIGFILMLYAWRVAPEKFSAIMITAGFSTVIAAVIGHYFGSRLVFHQWLGALIALIGTVLVNLDEKTWKVFFH